MVNENIERIPMLKLDVDDETREIIGQISNEVLIVAVRTGLLIYLRGMDEAKVGCITKAVVSAGYVTKEDSRAEGLFKLIGEAYCGKIGLWNCKPGSLSREEFEEKVKLSHYFICGFNSYKLSSVKKFIRFIQENLPQSSKYPYATDILVDYFGLRDGSPLAIEDISKKYQIKPFIARRSLSYALGWLRENAMDEWCIRRIPDVFVPSILNSVMWMKYQERIAKIRREIDHIKYDVLVSKASYEDSDELFHYCWERGIEVRELECDEVYAQYLRVRHVLDVAFNK